MIKTLSIKNFILIENLHLTFSKGFNVFTGETGAGKSVIIKAIDILFGAKSTSDMIKNGQDMSVLELSIDCSKNCPTEILKENGIEVSCDEIIISKEITKSTSRSRVNGSIVTLDFIKKLREFFIDIHSQHQTYVYMQKKYHITLLDNFCGNEHKQNLNNYFNAYCKYIDLEKKLIGAKNSLHSNEQEIDFLKYQIKEIEEASIVDIEEDKKLEEELERLSNAEMLKELSGSAYMALYGAETNIIEALTDVKVNISKISEYDKSISDYENEVISSIESLKETASFLHEYSENISADYERIDSINERLQTFNKLKRKYGNTLELILKYKCECEEKLSGMDFSKEDIEKLELETKQCKEILIQKGEILTKTRINNAKHLSEKICIELQKLELPKAKFEINVEKTENYNENGCNTVEFLISTNISEPVRPLVKIASGGEISRVMLAIKTIFSQSDNIDTVIFDEIDTGISGTAAQAAAEEILELSKTHQVVSVTHLPIIAAKAEKHFYVKKSQTDSTKVNVFDLDYDNKIKSLALMAGGEITEDTLNFAKGLIK